MSAWAPVRQEPRADANPLWGDGPQRGTDAATPVIALWSRLPAAAPASRRRSAEFLVLASRSRDPE